MQLVLTHPSFKTQVSIKGAWESLYCIKADTLMLAVCAVMIKIRAVYLI